MKAVLIAVALCLTAFAPAWGITDEQSRMAEEAIKGGVILVRNDSSTPYEVKRHEIGKHLLCLSFDLKNAGVIPITKTMFPSKESTVLVRCRDGKFHFARGYI